MSTFSHWYATISRTASDRTCRWHLLLLIKRNQFIGLRNDHTLRVNCLLLWHLTNVLNGINGHDWRRNDFRTHRNCWRRYWHVVSLHFCLRLLVGALTSKAIATTSRIQFSFLFWFQQFWRRRWQGIVLIEWRNVLDIWRWWQVGRRYTQRGIFRRSLRHPVVDRYYLADNHRAEQIFRQMLVLLEHFITNRGVLRRRWGPKTIQKKQHEKWGNAIMAQQKRSKSYFI